MPRSTCRGGNGSGGHKHIRLAEFLRNVVDLEQVLDDLLLMSVDPAGYHHEEQLQGLKRGFHGQEMLLVRSRGIKSCGSVDYLYHTGKVLTLTPEYLRFGSLIMEVSNLVGVRYGIQRFRMEGLKQDLRYRTDFIESHGDEICIDCKYFSRRDFSAKKKFESIINYINEFYIDKIINVVVSAVFSGISVKIGDCYIG